MIQPSAETKGTIGRLVDPTTLPLGQSRCDLGQGAIQTAASGDGPEDCRGGSSAGSHLGHGTRNERDGKPFNTWTS